MGLREQMAERMMGGEGKSAAAASGSLDADLAALGTGELRAAWRRTVGKPVPVHLPSRLLVRILAYRQQAGRYGDLSRQSQKLLARLERAGQDGGPGAGTVAEEPAVVARALKPGTLLVREHGGVVHQVMVMADGFSWRGEAYASLSRVAFAITGTRWNGPRFFGVGRR